MSINLTIITVVSIICATYLIIRFAEMWNKRTVSASRRLIRIISKLREENSELRKACDKVYDEWFEDFSSRQKSLNEILDKIYELEFKKT